MLPGSAEVIYALKKDGYSRHPFDCLFSRSETVHFEKITRRIEKLCYGLASEYLDIPAITLKVRRSYKYMSVKSEILSCALFFV